jgi:hypothetical protein
VPEAALMRMRLMAEYQMKCNVTDWTIPVGIFPSHWSGKSFAFDEMYGVQGLLSAGHFAEARRAADFRFKTLDRIAYEVYDYCKGENDDDYETAIKEYIADGMDNYREFMS